MRAAGLQIDGHADHVTATWFGIAYQPLKFQIGIFSDALVLHADVQAKRARCFSGLPPLNNADQKAERLHHPPHGTGGPFMLMNIKSILHYLAFDAFCPAFVPAIHRERPGEIRQEPTLAKYTRRGLDLDTYWFVQYGMTTQPYQFTKGSIFHLMEPDINQEIYGLPGYLSAIPSALLNESATLFRRKYYINGSHAGFIMYMTDAAQNQEDVNNLRNAMKSAKGPGNFRNLFMYSPNGKKDGLQIIPLSEVAAKDEFLNIKNVSRDDMMAAHRVPPQMMGIMPNNVGGFGDVEKASRVFVRNELIPLQKRLQELNNWLGDEVIRFEPYTLDIQNEKK